MLRRLFLAFALLPLAAAHAADAPATATLDEAREALQTGRTMVVDVREPEEHAEGVAAGAKLLPLRQAAARFTSLVPDKNQPVLLVCRTQNRSGALAKALRDAGYTQVRYVVGGMSEWQRRGLPMVKPPR